MTTLETPIEMTTCEAKRLREEEQLDEQEPPDSMEQLRAQAQELRRKLDLRERQLHTVHEISSALASQTDVNSILRETLRISLKTVCADAGSLLLYDAEKKKLVFEFIVGGSASLMGVEIDPETDLNGKASTVFRTGQTIITLDTVKSGYNPTFDQKTGYKTSSLITVPMQNMGGKPLGVMQALNKTEGHFDEEDQELLEIVGSLAATSIVNAKLAEEAQLAAVARAVGDLSHDIKNALTPVESMIDTTVEAFFEPMYESLDRQKPEWKAQSPQLATEIMDEIEPLRAWYPEMQSSVKDGCADIREMVSEIADYIKGTQSTYMEENNIEEVLEERLRRLRVVAKQRRITLHLNEKEAGITAIANEIGQSGETSQTTVPNFAFDRRLVGRAVFNLINNAMGAINDAVKKRTLELRPFNIWIQTSFVQDGAWPNGQYCLVEVRDDGPGIPPKVLESLFTPGVISTTDGGTGIGTRFVKSVADAHGGLVGVESEPGNGARFWLQLPLKK